MTRRKSTMGDLHENLTAFHEHGLWIPSRTIELRLHGEDDPELDHRTAGQFLRNLTVLESLSDEPIRVMMNCPGGSVVDGMAMFDAIQASKCETTCVVLGEAASMGAILLQAFTHRHSMPSARFLLHDGSDEQKGTIRDIEVAVAFGKRAREEDYRILAERTGKPAAYWRKKLAQDYILSAGEALNEGLIDEIL